MTREQIEKAIDVRLEEPDNQWDGIFNSGYSRGFREGVQWHISSVWHYDLDKVKTRKKVLVLFTYNRIRMYDDIRDIKGLEDLFVCFAYVDDLFPEREEVAK